jgi:hypothetical protein
VEVLIVSAWNLLLVRMGVGPTGICATPVLPPEQICNSMPIECVFEDEEGRRSPPLANE